MNLRSHFPNASDDCLRENMDLLTVIIDHLPYPELSPNARVHWAVKAKATKVLRAEVYWLAWEEHIQGPPMEQAVISYEFTVTSKRRRDLDNLVASMKAAQDGLVDAGVIRADDSQHLRLGKVSLVVGKEAKTTITVERIGTGS